MSKDTNVDFTIVFAKGKVEELESNHGEHGCNGLEKTLKLYTTNTTTNMHLFDANDTLKKYENIPSIIDSYYEVRLQMYQERKNYMIDSLEKELVLLSNKAKYIQEILVGTIDLRKKKREQVTEMLEAKGYYKMEDEEYKYLVKMPMDSVTEENIVKLLKDKGDKEVELEIIRNTSVNNMWLSELDKLRENYIEYKEARTRLMNGEEETNAKTNKKKVVSKGAIKKSVKKSIIIIDETD
jgi:DNA topoisomerase-2